MRLLTLVAFLLLQIHSYSQENADGNYTVGILPVTSVTNDAQMYTPNVQASLSKVFVEKTRFTVVDRTKFDQLAKESNLQKQEDFLNGAVVEQGKSLGAQYLISGNINQISKRAGNREKSKLDYDTYSKQYYTRIKRVAFLRGQAPDPTDKSGEKSAEEMLAEDLRMKTEAEEAAAAAAAQR